MARVVNFLGWNRKTIRKGQQELSSCLAVVDGRHRSGRRKAEEHLPSLLDDIESIVAPTGQTDPTFKSTRMYTPITAREVRMRLVRDKGYSNRSLICERSLRNKLNDLGYRPQRIAKCRPLKRIEQTDAIFNEVHRINDEADSNPGVLRISLDTKATVKIGPFSRGGKNRCGVKACDHYFEPESMLTPFGIFLPQSAASYLWFTEGKVTADFMVDRIEEMFAGLAPQQRPHTLVINADNGPENNGHRTQWLKRLVEFGTREQISIQLAYYPPYHSKYNPVDRLWGILENHWRGEILGSIEKVLGLARTMTYRGIRPKVRKVDKTYKSGVTLTKKES